MIEYADLVFLVNSLKLKDSNFSIHEFVEFFGPAISGCKLKLKQGGALPETNEIVTLICSCHNFFSLSSVQILFIPACCLLCVL